MVQDKPLRSSWEKKMAAKRDKDLVKKFALQLKQDQAKEKEVGWTECMLCAKHGFDLFNRQSHVVYAHSVYPATVGQEEKA